jgi:hypothetical protein
MEERWRDRRQTQIAMVELLSDIGREEIRWEDEKCENKPRVMARL